MASRTRVKAKAVKKTGGATAGQSGFKKRPFRDVAFGLLKGEFGTRSSVAYVASLRKAWR